MTAPKAAVAAGYAETTALKRTAVLLEQAREAGLIVTTEDAREPLEAMRAAVSAQDWTDIATRAVADAKAGDPQARSWLRDTLLGRPVTRVDATLDHRTVIAFEYHDAAPGTAADDDILDAPPHAPMLPAGDDDD